MYYFLKVEEENKKGKIVFGAVMPHPPIIVPQVGGKRIADAVNTRNSMEEVGRRLKACKVDTIVIITPHGEVGQAAVPVYTTHVYEGSFANFNAPKPVYKFKGDAELALSIVREARDANMSVSPIHETLLDHGVLVPLHYPYAAGEKAQIVPIAVAFLPLKYLFDFGRIITRAVEKSGKRVAFIASADMSHRLLPTSPAGYSPRAKAFDEKLVEMVKSHNVNGILEFDPVLAKEAAQDSLWSLAMLLGTLDGEKNIKHEVLSYEAPFGVGYMVATYEM